MTPDIEKCKSCKKEFEGHYRYGEPLYNKLCLDCRVELQEPCEEIKDEFKVGNRVMLENTGTYGAKKGATGKVVGIVYRAVDSIDILWDRNELHNGQHDGGYSPQDFKLMKEII